MPAFRRNMLIEKKNVNKSRRLRSLCIPVSSTGSIGALLIEPSYSYSHYTFILQSHCCYNYLLDFHGVGSAFLLFQLMGFFTTLVCSVQKRAGGKWIWKKRKVENLGDFVPSFFFCCGNWMVSGHGNARRGSGRHVMSSNHSTSHLYHNASFCGVRGFRSSMHVLVVLRRAME